MRRPSLPILVAMLALLGGCFVDRRGVRAIDPVDSGQLPDARAPDTGTDAGAVDARPVDAGGGSGDRDGDGFTDAVDLCPDDPDPEQNDLDGDGLGDVCDTDRDGDGLPNELDQCPDRDSRGSPDEDGDGVTDECDDCPLDADPGQPNADRDGLGDVCEDTDHTRFSRIAYLETFSGTLGELSADGSGVALVEGSAEVTSESERTLTRALDDDHPGNRYVVHTVGRYLGTEGTLGSGSFGVLLRWTLASGGRFGYRLELLAADDGVLLSRHDGGGCGVLGDEECVETLVDRDLGLRIEEDSTFALRATGYDDQLSLEVRNGAGTTTHRVSDVRHSVGGLGLRVREARVRFDAIAVYAP